MFTMHQIFGAEFANTKYFSKKEIHSAETNGSITKKTQELNAEAERIKNEKIESLITLLPILVLILGIIVMSILYSIFM